MYLEHMTCRLQSLLVHLHAGVDPVRQTTEKGKNDGNMQRAAQKLPAKASKSGGSVFCCWEGGREDGYFVEGCICGRCERLTFGAATAQSNQTRPKKSTDSLQKPAHATTPTLDAHAHTHTLFVLWRRAPPFWPLPPLHLPFSSRLLCSAFPVG
ncbi:uncharacterized protein SPSK_02025 [Sporothrix schenckii 1099-18]|uniref:Uncharacterized protein n=1 Tax=Sporothrix schenckii 1099-18 TaxID=1397361 RepID=A0A0F2MBW3_SPOSC|nr:uncharacterized protein SPSK_02025 [Sporothrix schenckii 1099-18]KJR87193.1 hypothetical protein SPSK_02025 [Sporothrix schenckii 1099-18]